MHFEIEIIAAIVIVIVICLLGTMILFSRSTEQDLLEGFWEADESFKQDADLNSMLMYLKDGRGYLVAENSLGVLFLNEPFTISLSGMCASPVVCGEREYQAEIEWDFSEHLESNFPSKFTMSFFPIEGRMILYQDGEIIADLYKNTSL